MKQTLLLLCVAFVSLTAAAQPVPEISLSATPEPSWRIGKKAIDYTQQDVWLPQTIETYDKDGNLTSTVEYFRDSDRDIISTLVTRSNGSLSKSTWTYISKHPLSYINIGEDYTNGKWVMTSKNSVEFEGNVIKIIIEYYDSLGNLTMGQERNTLLDTLKNDNTVSTLTKEDWYQWNNIEKKWEEQLKSTTKVNYNFDDKRRCLSIITQTQSNQSNRSSSVLFYYDGDNMAPYKCESKSGNDENATSYIYDNIQWKKYTSPITTSNPRSWLKSRWIEQDGKYVMHQDNDFASADIYYQENSNKAEKIGRVWTNYNGNDTYNYHIANDFAKTQRPSYDYSETVEKEEQTGKFVLNTRHFSYEETSNNWFYDPGVDRPVSLNESSSYFDYYSDYNPYTFKGNHSISYYDQGNYTSYDKMTKYNKEYQCWQEYESGTSDPYSGYNDKTTQKVTKYQFFPAQSSGINTVPSQSATGSAVYNLQGLKVGDSLKGLPVGIYIVKQDGKSFKVVKEK